MHQPAVVSFQLPNVWIIRFRVSIDRKQKNKWHFLFYIAGEQIVKVTLVKVQRLIIYQEGVETAKAADTYSFVL